MDFFSPNGMGASFCALCFGTEFARQALVLPEMGWGCRRASAFHLLPRSLKVACGSICS